MYELTWINYGLRIAFQKKISQLSFYKDSGLVMKIDQGHDMKCYMHIWLSYRLSNGAMAHKVMQYHKFK